MTLTVDIADLSPVHFAEIMEIEKVSNGAPWSQKSFENELHAPQSRFRVGLVAGAVVAYAGIWCVVDEAHITTIAVRPDMRGQGVGRRMMLDLMQQARSAGMSCMTLEVRAGNRAAIALYESLGFASTAVRKGYYPDNKEDALVMWLYELSPNESPR